MSEKITHCEKDDCAGMLCKFHSLEPIVQDCITTLEAENAALKQELVDLRDEVATLREYNGDFASENARLKQDVFRGGMIP